MDEFDPRCIKTLADIEWYLMSWLRRCTEEESSSYSVNYQGKTFTACMGFRRCFHIHTLYRNKDTNEFAFHVVEDCNLESFPNFGIYETFTECIRGVAEKYMKAWKIPRTLEPNN